MNVSAIIVTRGDQDVMPILASLPDEWEKIVWDNGEGCVLRWPSYAASGTDHFDASDLSVYGRYAAIEYASGDLIYVQDDDCVVSDPQAVVDAYNEHANGWRFDLPDPKPSPITPWPEHVVCNMPPEFRHDFYSDHALVGFGACFHRDAPQRAFERFANDGGAAIMAGSRGPEELEFWRRTCDIVFTALTPRVLVDVPKENLPWAYHYDRMWRQPEHQAERVRMLDLVRQIR